MRLSVTLLLSFTLFDAFPQAVSLPKYKDSVAFIAPYDENYKTRPVLGGEQTIRDYFHFGYFDFKKGSFVDKLAFQIDSFVNMECGVWIHSTLEETCSDKLELNYFQLDDSTFKYFYQEMSGMAYTIKHSHLSQKEICSLKISNEICDNLRRSGNRYLMAYMYKFYNKFPDRKTSSFLVLDLHTGHPVYYKSSILNTIMPFSESRVRRHVYLRRISYALSDRRRYGYENVSTPSEQLLYYDVIRLTKNFLHKIKKPK